MRKKKNRDMTELIDPPKFESQIYHSKSKYYFENMPKKFTELPKSWTTIHFKQYQRFKSVKLSRPIKFDTTLLDALTKRESNRKYSKTPISFEKLSTILSISAGIKNKTDNPNLTRRGQPSAGARYPLEMYILCLNCHGLRRGVYHYNVKQNALELIRDDITKKELLNYFDQPWMFDSAAIILLTGVFGRTNIKYKERGYRYVLFEAGHVAQNLCLISAALELGSCCIGGFCDDRINSMLDLNESLEAVIYCLVIGNVSRS